jgi:hypothetical protein
MNEPPMRPARVSSAGRAFDSSRIAERGIPTRHDDNPGRMSCIEHGIEYERHHRNRLLGVRFKDNAGVTIVYLSIDGLWTQCCNPASRGHAKTWHRSQ